MYSKKLRFIGLSWKHSKFGNHLESDLTGKAREAPLLLLSSNCALSVGLMFDIATTRDIIFIQIRNTVQRLL